MRRESFLVPESETRPADMLQREPHIAKRLGPLYLSLSLFISLSLSHSLSLFLSFSLSLILSLSLFRSLLQVARRHGGRSSLMQRQYID